VQFPGVVLFPLVQNLERFQWLAQPIQFAGNAFSGRTPHAGVRADAVEPSSHMRATQKFGFTAQLPREAIPEAAFQGAVDEQVGVT